MSILLTVGMFACPLNTTSIIRSLSNQQDKSVLHSQHLHLPIPLMKHFRITQALQGQENIKGITHMDALTKVKTCSNQNITHLPSQLVL